MRSESKDGDTGRDILYHPMAVVAESKRRVAAAIYLPLLKR